MTVWPPGHDPAAGPVRTVSCDVGWPTVQAAELHGGLEPFLTAVIPSPAGWGSDEAGWVDGEAGDILGGALVQLAVGSNWVRRRLGRYAGSLQGEAGRFAGSLQGEAGLAAFFRRDGSDELLLDTGCNSPSSFF